MMRRLLAGCLAIIAFATSASAQSPPVETKHIDLFDTLRQRPVPIVVYKNTDAGSGKTKLKLAIISHGYGGKNTDYTFIASTLVKLGYLVASVQHEIPGDEPLATTGKLPETRRPNWERGIETIRFVAQTLERTQPTIDRRRLLLVGHSNGGDMAMLFARTYPAQVTSVITLDNRRMPFPRAKRPRILSIRSSDQVADPGVLPTPAEQRTYGTTIVQQLVVHNDMWDGATDNQKRAMTEAIIQFLK